MGIELLQPAFVMRIKNIEAGSPAAATGKLEKGKVIESINGQKLADIDPRIQLGQILAAAEASDGVLKFVIKGKAEPAYITEEFLEDFKGGSVSIAAMTFIRYNDKYKVKPSSKTPQGKFSLHFEEQKLPPMGDDLVRKSASVVPMFSSEWQDKLNPDDNEQLPDDNKFRWDGKFVGNPMVMGTWKVISEVTEIAEFDLDGKFPKARKPPYSTITLSGNGATGDPAWLWSGDRLMDLNSYQALQMRMESLGDGEYLFIEAGGFSTRNKPDWKSNWYVLTRP